jgi:hypothetical protein
MSELQIQEPNLIVAPWLQIDEEPILWYRRFMMYYLPLGPNRNLTRAYFKWVETENPKRAAKLKANRAFINTSKEWSVHARDWKWRTRAEAFDLHCASEVFAYIDQARETLMKSANDAATALIENLKNPRLGVQAAKEILDRVGLPSTHLVGIGKIEPYSADELRKAEEEVADWERNIRGDVIDGTAD